MANARRGEVGATIAGRHYTLCLTLGALAELEQAFAVDDLAALATRFARGRLSALDLIRIFGAGLRGAGQSIGDDEVRLIPVGEGLAAVAGAVAELLEATFGGDGAPPENPPGPQDA